MAIPEPMLSPRATTWPLRVIGRWSRSGTGSGCSWRSISTVGFALGRAEVRTWAIVSARAGAARRGTRWGGLRWRARRAQLPRRPGSRTSGGMPSPLQADPVASSQLHLVAFDCSSSPATTSDAAVGRAQELLREAFPAGERLRFVRVGGGPCAHDQLVALGLRPVLKRPRSTFRPPARPNGLLAAGEASATPPPRSRPVPATT